jgi:serine/threonine-protein phosphatase 4 regulatory subunit 2
MSDKVIDIDEIIKHCRLTGELQYNWIDFKNIIKEKLAIIISNYGNNLEEFENTNEYRLLIQNLDSLKVTPFTIQRICDLLNEPKKHYKINCTKFLFSFHKLVNLD